jgi:hypothetical protein
VLRIVDLTLKGCNIRIRAPRGITFSTRPLAKLQIAAAMLPHYPAMPRIKALSRAAAHERVDSCRSARLGKQAHRFFRPTMRTAQHDLALHRDYYFWGPRQYTGRA